MVLLCCYLGRNRPWCCCWLTRAVGGSEETGCWPGSEPGSEPEPELEWGPGMGPESAEVIGRTGD